MPETPSELAHDAIDEVKELMHEAEEGKSARTPALLVGGITMVVAVVITLLMVIAFTAYYLSN